MALRVELEAKSKSEMVGEFLRELAVLVLVFVPLEVYIPSKDKGILISSLDPKWVLVGSLAGSAVLLTVGIWLERRRA